MAWRSRIASLRNTSAHRPTKHETIGPYPRVCEALQSTALGGDYKVVFNPPEPVHDSIDGNSLMENIDALLTKYEADFVRAVVASPGAKHAYTGPAPESGPSVWTKPEQMGLVVCIGSYKWEPGPNLVQVLYARVSGQPAGDE